MSRVEPFVLSERSTLLGGVVERALCLLDRARGHGSANGARRVGCTSDGTRDKDAS